jgi:flagellar biosynthesis/type III secretory pathway chaperone
LSETAAPISSVSVEASIAKAMERVDELEKLLDLEFEALKAQNLSDFDSLTETKNQLLKELMALTGVHKPEDAGRLDTRWDAFKQKMRYCKNLHRRSEILVTRKLDAITGALESLRNHSPASSVETYDRLGKIRRGRQITGFMSI